jgi:subtilisin family serine protease
VAVIDNGVDNDHQDLRDNIWKNLNEIPGNGIDDDNNGFRDDINGYNFASNIANPSPQGTWSGNGHGTHVAGVTAAQEGNGKGIAGINGRFGRIMALNVFGASPNGDNDVIANAIDYAWRNGAQVINMSLGGQSPSSAILAAMNRAVSNGVFIVVAAGNSSCDMTNPGSGTCSNGGTNYFSPGASNAEITGGTPANNGFLSVGAINQSTGAKCSFSNYGASVVEIGAPGCTDILSTLPGNAYVASGWSGTSMASPMVAGGVSLAIGLIRDRTGSLPSPALVEEVVIAGTRKVASLNTSFEEGQVLDLVGIAAEIDRRFPASSGGGGGPVPPPCP